MFAKSTQIDCVGEILVPRESDRKPSHAAISAKPSFAIGNAIAEGRRGWFIGQFFPADAGLLSQSTIEVKWGQHQKGACRANFAASRFGGTISVLISGHFLLK